MYRYYTTTTDVPYMQINAKHLMELAANAHQTMQYAKEDYIEQNSFSKLSMEDLVEKVMNSYVFKAEILELAYNAQKKNGFWNRGYNRKLKTFLLDTKTPTQLVQIAYSDVMSLSDLMVKAILEVFEKPSLDALVIDFDAEVEERANSLYDYKIKSIGQFHDRLLGMAPEALETSTINLDREEFEALTDVFIDEV